jgi:hypothetical protein
MNYKHFRKEFVILICILFIGLIVISASSKNITESLNQPPEIPIITGQTNGKAGTIYEYSFFSVDPEGDNISYYVDWGDKCGGYWIDPHPSGVEAKANHSYALEGTYIINAIAVDSNGAESTWGTLEVTMPKNIPVVLSYFLWFFNKILFIDVLFDLI